MYDSIRIQNFRGLRDLTIENLGRVNLIVGANNVGKTSVLEALALLRARSDGTEIRQMLTSRGYRQGDSFTDVWAELTRQDAVGFSVTGDWAGSRHGVVGYTNYEGGAALVEGETVTNYLVQVVGEDVKKGRAVPSLVLVHLDLSGDQRPAGQSLPINPSQLRIDVTLPDSHALPTSWGREAIFGPTLWLPLGYSFGTGGMADALTRIQGSSRNDRLVDAVRWFDERITGLYPGYDSQSQRPVIRVGVRSLDFNLSISTLGDGVRRMVELLVAAPLASGGVVLIDEIDTGVYYRNLNQLWSAVGFLTAHDDVQLFSTTHSWECVEAAVDAFKDTPEAFRLHRISRREDGLHVTTYDHETAEAASEMLLEVR